MKHTEFTFCETTGSFRARFFAVFLGSLALSIVTTALSGAAPLIVSGPSLVQGANGGPRGIQIEAIGEDLSYQWYRGEAGDQSHPIDGPGGALLLRHRLEPTARFWVQVKNTEGAIDSRSIEAVTAPPQIGALVGTGSDAAGQLGQSAASFSIRHLTPVLVAADVIQMAAGENHTLLVRADGSLWGTGANTFGQLGTGTTGFQTEPVKIADDIVQAAAGRHFSLIIKADGSLWAMGSNEFGQLGDGTTTDRHTPVFVTDHVTQIAAGTDHAHFVKDDGTLWAMGINTIGQLGDGTTAGLFPMGKSTPVQVAEEVVGVTAGTLHTLFWKSDGSLWGHGGNNFGAIGAGDAFLIPSPKQIADHVVQASAGDLYSLFLTTEGRLFAMGRNHRGQLGDGTTTDRSVPKAIAEGVVYVTAGAGHSFFLKADGSLWGMGANEVGELGHGPDQDRVSPVEVDKGIALVAAGGEHSLFLRSLDILAAPDTAIAAGEGARLAVEIAETGGPTFQWFQGEQGDTSQPIEGAQSRVYMTPPLEEEHRFWVRMNDGDVVRDSRTMTVSVATAPPSLPQPAKAHIVPADQTVALSCEALGGALSYQWYRGEPGDLSDPLKNGTSPLLLHRLPATPTRYWVRMSNPLGLADSTAVEVDPTVVGGRTLMGLGDNRSGQLGPATDRFTEIEWTPVAIAEEAVHMAAHDDATLWIDEDGALWGLGSAHFGKLGRGPEADPRVPFRVAEAVRTVVAGGDHTLFVTRDLQLMGMGRNDEGQLGDGTRNNRTVPAKIDDGVVAAAAGGAHSLYLKTDGTLWAIGAIRSGQLGVGHTSSEQWPVLVDSEVAAFAAGTAHSHYIKSDGSLWAMGENSNGELGDGSTTDRQTPVRIATNAVTVSILGSYTEFLQRDGSLWAIVPRRPSALPWILSNDPKIPQLRATGVIQAPGGQRWIQADGSLWGKGDNSNGRLGTTPAPADDGPRKIAEAVRQVATGGGNTLFTHTIDLRGPESLELAAGHRATLQVEAISDGPISYQWYTGLTGDVSHPIVGATNTTWETPLLIANQSYWVRVTSNAVSRDSAPAHVAVAFQAPSFTRPTEIIAIPGTDTVALRAEASGDAGIFHYQWYHGASGDISQPVVLGHGPVVVVTQEASAQPYWLRLSNPLGTVDSATLIVSPRADAGILFRMGERFGHRWVSPGEPNPTPTRVADDVITFQVGGYANWFITDDRTLWGLGPIRGTWSPDLAPFVIANEVVFAHSTGSSSVVETPKAGPLTLYSENLLYVKAGGELRLRQHMTEFWSNTTETERALADGVIRAVANDRQTFRMRADGSLWSGESRIADGVIDLATGRAHLLFLQVDGTLWAMGTNDDGQLGVDEVSEPGTPVLVSHDVRQIAAGDHHSLFIKHDGTLWAMGRNTEGQLGDGTEISRPLPVEITSGVTAAAAGAEHTLFIRDDGSLWAVGRNQFGQLGNGTTVDAATPVMIAQGVLKVSAGGFQSLFLQEDVIAVEPADQTIHVGATAELEVIVEPGKATDYQWFQGASGDTSAPLAGATENTLHTAELNDGESYWVRVTWNGMTTQSRTVRVDVASYARWATAHELPGEHAGFFQSATDDGIANGLKYACGLNPQVPTEIPALLTATRTVDTGWRVQYPLRKDRPGATVRLEMSHDLQTWTPVASDILSVVSETGELQWYAGEFSASDGIDAFRLVATEEQE